MILMFIVRHMDSFQTIAFSVSGEKLWTAELPTNESGDRYYRAYLSDGLMADSPKSFACRINESSGRILRKVFYK